MREQKRTFHLIKTEKPSETIRLFENEDDAFSVRRCHELTGISEKTIRRLITEGKIPGFRLGRKFFVVRDGLRDYMLSGGGL